MATQEIAEHRRGGREFQASFEYARAGRKVDDGRQFELCTLGRLLWGTFRSGRRLQGVEPTPHRCAMGVHGLRPFHYDPSSEHRRRSIPTDLGGAQGGSAGASANIHPGRVSRLSFEPVHGSARPGRKSVANPIALSAPR